MVVAEAAEARSIKTHVGQYTLKCFSIGWSPSCWGGPLPAYTGARPGGERVGSFGRSYSALTPHRAATIPGRRVSGVGSRSFDRCFNFRHPTPDTRHPTPDTRELSCSRLTQCSVRI